MLPQNAALDAANKFIGIGLHPVPLKAQDKLPVGTWPDPSITAANTADYFKPDSNIGVVMGEGIIDVDLDSPEAIALAKKLFPSTWSFGHSGNVTHLFVGCDDIKTRKFCWPKGMADDGGSVIAEIRSSGSYTMAPPSTHPNGNTLEWGNTPSTPILELSAEDLENRLNMLVGAAIIVREWDTLDGSRHDVMNALTGACCHAGWSEKQLEVVMSAVIDVIDDSEKRDRATSVVTTANKFFHDNELVTGLPALSELLDDHIIDALKKYWGLGKATEAPLTFSGKTVAEVVPAVEQWPELLPFDDSFKNVEHVFPVDALGSTMAAAVRDVIAIQQVPDAMAAQSVLMAASSVAHMVYSVYRDLQEIPLSLWMIAVAAPGERKSSTERLVYQELRKHIKVEAIEYLINLQAWKAQCKEDPANAGPRPRSPEWLITRGTVEGLLNTLDKNWPAITFSTSDAGSWLGGYSMREGRGMATAAVLSDLWSGQPYTNVNKSDDAPVAMCNRRLALSLMIQPNIAGELFNSDLLQGQGFLSRCLPSFPKTMVGTRFTPATKPGTAGLDAFNAVLCKLLTIKPEIEPLQGDITFKKITLDPEAEKLAKLLQDDIERRVGVGGIYEHITEVTNKAVEQVIRLAGVRVALEGSLVITEDHIADAKKLVTYYLDTWLHLTGKLHDHSAQVSEPKALLKWLEAQYAKGIFDTTLSNMYRSGPNLIRNKSDKAKQLVGELIRRGYVKKDKKRYKIRKPEW